MQRCVVMDDGDINEAIRVLIINHQWNQSACTFDFAIHFVSHSINWYHSFAIWPNSNCFPVVSSYAIIVPNLLEWVTRKEIHLLLCNCDIPSRQLN